MKDTVYVYERVGVEKKKQVGGGLLFHSFIIIISGMNIIIKTLEGF
jgi:hypothetical protein